MDSLVGARHEVCYEFGGRILVLAEPGRSFSRSLGGNGDAGLCRNVSCRVSAHPVCHDPDAAVIQEG